MDSSQTYGVKSAASLVGSFTDTRPGDGDDDRPGGGARDAALTGGGRGTGTVDEYTEGEDEEDEVEGGSDVTLNPPIRPYDYARPSWSTTAAEQAVEGAAAGDRSEGTDGSDDQGWSGATQAGAYDQDMTPSCDAHPQGGFFAFQAASSSSAAESGPPPHLEPAEGTRTTRSTLAVYLASQLLDGDVEASSPPGSPHSLASSTSSWPASEVLSYPHSMVGSVDGRGGMLTDDEGEYSSGGSAGGRSGSRERERLHSRGSSQAAGLNVAASDLVMPRLPFGSTRGRGGASLRSSSSSRSGSRPSSSSSSSALVSGSGLAISSVDVGVVGGSTSAAQRRPSTTSLNHSLPGTKSDADARLRPTLPVALIVGDVTPKTVEKLKAQGWAIERVDPKSTQSQVLETVVDPLERLYRMLFRRVEGVNGDVQADLEHLVELWLEKESRMLCVYGFQRAPVSSASLDFLLELARLVPLIPVFRSTASDVVVAPCSDSSPPQSDADALAILSRQLRSRRVPTLRPPVPDHSFSPPSPRACAAPAVTKWMTWKQVEDAVGGLSPPASARQSLSTPQDEERDDDRWAERVAARREEVHRQRSGTLKPAASAIRANRLSSSSMGSTGSEVSQIFLRSGFCRQAGGHPFRPRCASSPQHHRYGQGTSFLVPSLPPLPVLLHIGIGVAWASVQRVVVRGIHLANAFAGKVDEYCSTARTGRRRLRPVRAVVATVVGMLGVSAVTSFDEWTWTKAVAAGVGVAAIGVGAIRLLGI